MNRILIPVCAILAMLALTAMFSATAHAACKPLGNPVASSDAQREPDFKATASRGDFVQLSDRDAFALTEWSVYPLHTGKSQQFRCMDRQGVLYFAWRTLRGRLLATFDGRTFFAHAMVRVWGWES